MASYLVTGASRGLGFEFLSQLSSNPANIVIGLVRDKTTTDEKVTNVLGKRDNVHILKADISDYNALVKSVPEVVKITGGKLDYVIANAAVMGPLTEYSGIGDLVDTPMDLEKDLRDCFNINVVSNIHLFNLYMPLVLKGNAKKVITISTGMADIDLITKFGVASAPSYAISKAAMNAAVAKFAAQYGKDGVLFMSISPGLVDTGAFDNREGFRDEGFDKTANTLTATEEQKKGAMVMMAKFADYAPHFTGPSTPESSVKNVMAVINKASVEGGDGGSFVSHFGNKQWL